jgi:prepilin peptidase CpaA
VGAARRVRQGGAEIDALRLAQNGLLVAFLLTVMVTDWRWQRIPNVVTYPAIAVGLALSALGGIGQVGATGLLDHVAAVVVAFLFCYPFYAAGGLKAGDVKLLMSVGALRGTGFLLLGAFYGAIIGGLVAVAVIVVRRLQRPAPGEEPRALRKVLKTWFPYGVALGAGGLLALVVETTRA